MAFLLGFINILGIIYFSSLNKSVRESLVFVLIPMISFEFLWGCRLKPSLLQLYSDITNEKLCMLKVCNMFWYVYALWSDHHNHVKIACLSLHILTARFFFFFFGWEQSRPVHVRFLECKSVLPTVATTLYIRFLGLVRPVHSWNSVSFDQHFSVLYCLQYGCLLQGKLFYRSSLLYLP